MNAILSQIAMAMISYNEMMRLDVEMLKMLMIAM